MPAAKFSISLSRELQESLTRLARQRGEERSRLIETLLRENPLVQATIRELRQAGPETKRGRPLEKLLVLARAARRDWDRRVASGQVKVHARSS